jgi:transposase
MDLTDEQWEVLEPLIPEPPRRVTEKAHSRKSNFVLCSDLRTPRAIGYTGRACSATLLEEFFSETANNGWQPSLRVK